MYYTADMIHAVHDINYMYYNISGNKLFKTACDWYKKVFLFQLGTVFIIIVIFLMLDITKFNIHALLMFSNENAITSHFLALCFSTFFIFQINVTI